MSKKKNMILCADDYGLNAAISTAILELAKSKRISATSAMTNMPYWQQAATDVNVIQKTIDVGLHINLTEGSPLSTSFKKCYQSFPSLKALIAKTCLKNIPKQLFIDEIKAQIDAFETHCNDTPIYIDSHHHVLNLPIIRDAFWEVREKHLPENVLVRSMSSFNKLSLKDTVNLKPLIVGALGGFLFKKEALRHHHTHTNSSFQGFYNFKPGQYREHFKQFLFSTDDMGMIMCHPGYASQEKISAARTEEFEYFKNPAFQVDLSRFDMKIIRPSEMIKHLP